MSLTHTEIVSQPETWQRAVAMYSSADFPADGESVAVIGCGTSWFMAQAYCRARESLGKGVSDPFTATEFPLERSYDTVIVISRSGTTTEIVEILRKLHGKVRTLLITAVGNGPAAPFTDREIVLDFADERSVVQTRFATSALALLRTSLGQEADVLAAIEDARAALAAPIPAEYVEAEAIVFLGTNWTIGLANEAALKLREASQSWTESYPAMEYRHGPISIAQPGRLTWVFGPTPLGLDGEVRATGAMFETSTWDPMAHLVFAQRVALARAEARGLNPDLPRHLTRSVILEEDQVSELS